MKKIMLLFLLVVTSQTHVNAKASQDNNNIDLACIMTPSIPVLRPIAGVPAPTMPASRMPSEIIRQGPVISIGRIITV